MIRKLLTTTVCAGLALFGTGEDASARGFGGGGRGGFGGGGAGFRGGYGGYGGMRGGGMPSYSRTPSFSPMNRGPSGFNTGANFNAGSRSGSYTTQRGTTI